MDNISRIMHAAVEICRRSGAWLVRLRWFWFVISVLVILTLASYWMVHLFQAYLDAQLQYREQEIELYRKEREDAIRFQCKHYETIYGWDYDECLTAANVQPLD